MLENPHGEVFSGPGIRAVDTVLRGQRQPDFPATLVISPQQNKMLFVLPIPVRGLEPPVNGRSMFMKLESDGEVYLASLAMFAKKNGDGSDRAPTLSEWQELLDTSNLAMPRDKTPTPLDRVGGQLIYSRVAGVQEGSSWQAQLVDGGKEVLTIPETGDRISYAISTLRGGRLGTEQIQAAKMLVRYPDTAYESHGNYGVYYDLTLPLYNPSDRDRTVAITLANPIKEDKLSKSGLRFRQPPLDFPFFRGTVRLRYVDEGGKPVTRYLHLWQRSGQIVDPLLTLSLKAKETRSLRVDFFYPPDSTPPQVLTIATL